MKKIGSLHSMETNSSLRKDAVKKQPEALKDLSKSLSAALEALETLEILGVDRPVDVRGGVNFYDEVSRFEINLIQQALKCAGGHQSHAATLLGLNPTTLNSKIKAYKIDWRAPFSSRRGNRRTNGDYLPAGRRYLNGRESDARA